MDGNIQQNNNHVILSADNTNQDGFALYRRSDPIYVRILICFTLQSYHMRKLIFERLSLPNVVLRKNCQSSVSHLKDVICCNKVGWNHNKLIGHRRI
jgi:hypothetical protein